MRRPVIGTALLALVLVASPATADPSDPSDPADPPPSRADVRHAEQDAHQAAADVAAVQRQIDNANATLEAAAVAAAQAAEAYNGARYRLQLARVAERAAIRESRRTARELRIVKRDYRDAVLGSFVANPELDAFGALLDSDGLPSLLDRVATSGIVQGEFEQQRAAYEDARDAARDAAGEATLAVEDAEDAADEARDAKEEAAAAVAAATSAATTFTAEKTRLLRRMAQLQGISVALAEDRQSALEERRRVRAETEREKQQGGELDQQADPPSDASQSPDGAEDPGNDGDATPEPTDEDPPPSDATGSVAAIGFAQAQLGEPYVWAAAGPDTWDCSGLTMGAWAAAGKSLPHYSVAQYEQSTPISAADLRPGDLVFWGSSSSPSSIYHVALYAGEGMIIHAPRTGRPVSEESMYYWIPPTHFARP